MKKQVEKFYDGHAPTYESKFQVPMAKRIKRMEEEGILAFLFEHLPAPGGARLLELGCGTGLFTIPVAKEGYEVTAVDISDGMLKELAAKVEGQGIAGVTTRKADAEALGDDPDRYDAVYGIGLLEYLDSPADLVARAAGLLRPGGVAVFTAPTVSINGLCYYLTSRLRKGMRMKIFTGGALSRIFTGAGLELLCIRPVGFHLPLMKPLTRVAAGRLGQGS